MYYVYRFLDKANQIVYVGKTGHLEKRMTEHFSRQGHLTEEQYKQVEKIEYVELAFQLDMDILEKYLINLWKPPFNSVDKDSDITLFSFNNVSLKWKNFDKKKVIKPKQSVVILLKEKTQKPKTNHYLVEQLKISNELVKILNQSNLTLNEHKILNAMFAQINPEDTEFKLLTLSSGEIKKLCNFNNSDNFKRDINTNIYNISNMMLIDNKNKQFSLLATLKYENGTLFFQFNNYLKPFLLNLKENFTQKRLKEIQEYENKYALRLDMLFTMYFNKQTSKVSPERKLSTTIRFSYDIEELKKILGVQNKYQNRFNNFWAKVLSPAKEEINEKGYYKLNLEVEKSKRKAQRIVFFVSLGEKSNKTQEIKEQIKNKDISFENKIKKIFSLVGFSDEEIDFILDKNSITEIKKVLKELKDKKEKFVTTKEKKEYIQQNLLKKSIKETEIDDLLSSL